MKVRHLKHYNQSGMAWNNWMHWFEKRNYADLTGLKTFAQGRRDVPFPGVQFGETGQGTFSVVKIEPDAVVIDNVDEVLNAKQEFVVVKKNGGEVVDTFDTREDAEALIEKHKKQKKAALVLLDTAEATS